MLVPVYTVLVYTIFVKNITLSADENLIEQAREVARAQHTTLNAAFREWLEQYSGREERARRFDEIMERTKYLKADRKYTRDELNER
jgi:hypothetical protein